MTFLSEFVRILFVLYNDGGDSMDEKVKQTIVGLQRNNMAGYFVVINRS